MSAEQRPTGTSPAPGRWLAKWGSSRRLAATDEKAAPQGAEASPSLLRSSDAAFSREAEVNSPRTQAVHAANEAFISELSKHILRREVSEVMEIISATALPDRTTKADPALGMALVEALSYLAIAGTEQPRLQSTQEWRTAIFRTKEVLAIIGEQACQGFGSIFMRGIDIGAIVRLLRSDVDDIRGVIYFFFCRLFTDSLDKPWTMSHREKRMNWIEAFTQAVLADATDQHPVHLELYSALQLFVTSSLLNPPSEATSDPALDAFEAERGYEAVMNVIEKNPQLSEPLLDFLRCLTYLGGVPKDYEEAYQASLAENSDEPIQEAKNSASFAIVARLLSKMLSASSDAEPYCSIRLPLLHCVMGVYSSNPKNFGVLERQFQVLSQLSRRVGEKDCHDEILFMTVKIFEMVALGLEYRPVTAVTVLCDVSLPALLRAGDDRSFSCLANTLLKLVQRHASLALDCGLLKNLILPELQSASRSSAPMVSGRETILTDCLLLLSACLERHQSAVPATKESVFKNNCATARASGVNGQCKEIILNRLKLEQGPDVKSQTIAGAVTIMAILAKDEPDTDLTWILELIQHPLMNQSSVSLRFRERLFRLAWEALQANPQSWGGTAVFDCVLTVILSMEGAFDETRLSTRSASEFPDAFGLLKSSLGLLGQSVRHMRSGSHVDFEALFSVLRITGVLQSLRFATEFVNFVLNTMVVSSTGSCVDEVDPLVLIGALVPNLLEASAKHQLFAKLCELVANDGEFSCWNRQQLARFRLAERIVDVYRDELLDESHPLHDSLSRVVSCVGNQCASPELLDKLLRLAYRVAPGDTDGKFELRKVSSSVDALHQAEASLSVMPDVDRPKGTKALECVLRILQQVAEPKMIGRHAIFGRYPDDEYCTPYLEMTLTKKRHWPPGTAAAVASGGINSSAYSFSCWLWLALGNNAPKMEILTIFGASQQLLSISLDLVNDPNDEVASMMSRRLIVVKSPNNSVASMEASEIYGGRWNHVVIVHKRAEQRNIVSSFWAGNQDLKGGAGKIELFVNGALVETSSLHWPSSVDSPTPIVARLGGSLDTTGDEITRFRLGPTALFEGALSQELVTGLFMRGPSYRGALTKQSPVVQDKRACIASAFERMHLLSRDDDFVNRIGGVVTSWRGLQKFAISALGARIDPKLVAPLFRFDPNFHEEPDLREIVPLTIQDSLSSLGGASICFLPLLLRVGTSLKVAEGAVCLYDSTVVSSVLSLLRDALRSSDRARFAFRLEDGYQVLAWLLHMITQARDKSDLDIFRVVLSIAATGTGFDATIVDSEALLFIAMNDHVWRQKHSSRVSWKLVAELLPWLSKLVHPSNRHRLYNFAALHPLNVFEWVLSTMILLIAETQPGVGSKEANRQGFELLWLASNLLEGLFRCEPDAISIIFQYVLVTLSSASSSFNVEEETILQMLVRANRLLSSLGDEDQENTSLLPPTDVLSPSGTMSVSGSITLDDLRCTLLDVLVRFRRPPLRADPHEVEEHSNKVSSLYEQYGNGDWLGCIMEYASEDYETIRRVLAFCEVEFAENPEYAKMFLQNKCFKIFCDTLHSSRYANATEVILFWARLASCTRPTSDAFSYVYHKLSPRVSEINADDASVIDLVEIRKGLDTISQNSAVGTLKYDPMFAAAAFDSLHGLIRENALRLGDGSMNNELIRFMWNCAKNSVSLAKQWTTSVCLRSLVKTVFTLETFKQSEDSRDQSLTVTESHPPVSGMEFLVDLIAWSLDPAEAYRTAASMFPEDAMVDRVASYQNRLFQGLRPWAVQNSFLASALIQRASLGWTPGLETSAISLALECKGINLQQMRSVVLCAVDRNYSSAEDSKILDFLMMHLADIINGPDSDAFVACLARCVFPIALEQAMTFSASGTTSNIEDACAKSPAWRFFSKLCSEYGDSVRKLMVTDDASLQVPLQSALARLDEKPGAIWLVEFGVVVRPVISANAHTIWSREMERQAGRWYVPGRVPSSAGEDVMSVLVEMTRTSNSERNLLTGRVRGWNTPRDRSDTFLTSGKIRLERVVRSRQQAFQKQEQLFFSKFEDLLRGKKSWGGILRRAQLPNSPWEPFQGRKLDLEEQHQRWKLDPFEDPSRVRRRLRQNRTFYKRYKLTQVQVARSDDSAFMASGPEIQLAAVNDRTKALRSDEAKRGGTETLSEAVEPPLKVPNTMTASDAPMPTSIDIMRALRKPHQLERVRTNTLVTHSSAELADETRNDDFNDELSTSGSELDDRANEIAVQLGVKQQVLKYNDDEETGDEEENVRVSSQTTPEKERSHSSLQRLRSAESSASSRAGSESESPMRRTRPSRTSDFNSTFDDLEASDRKQSDAEGDYVIVDIRVRAHRERVRAELDPQDRDNIVYRTNCSTVRGLEERRGLCLLAKTSLYVVDNYEIELDGTIIEVVERNQRFNVQVRQQDESVLIGEDAHNDSVLLRGKVTFAKAVSHRKRRVRYDDVIEAFRRRFLFRDVGLEIFCSDGSTLLIVFETKSNRDRFQQELKKVRKRALAVMDLPFTRNPVASADSILAGLTLDSARRRWVAGALSNFDYLTILNTLAGRSYNDPAQYPVFPWVLADYESAILSLDDPSIFRNLSKPMGALTDERIAYASDRYHSLEASAETTGIPPFHFGTHYSCSGYVANFLFRLEPFSRMALQLQGGAFDRADRLFRSVEATWRSASGLNLNMQDVRELVPEFYCMHEFLENRNRFELGVTQRGATVGDVELPPWAHGSALEFIRLHRKALESKYVSEHLHEWIDLIFGFKQRGREAIKALNVFHPLTYEGEVNLDAITDPDERAATMEQIHSFGQTPTKLFDSPHPKREVQPPENWSWHAHLAPALVVPGAFDRKPGVSVVGTLPMECLAQNQLPELHPGEIQLVRLEDLPGFESNTSCEVTVVNASSDGRIVDLLLDDADRLFVLKARSDMNGCFISHSPTKHVIFGSTDGSLDFHATSSGGPLSSELVDKLLTSFEDLHRGAVSHVCVWDDGKLLATAGTDGIIRIWRVRRSKDVWRLDHEGTNAGNKLGGPVTCMHVSKEQQLLVTGSEDGSANVWDLGRRQELIRRLSGHQRPIRFVGVNSFNSDIMTVCEREVRLWHVNGQLIASAEFKSEKLAPPSAALAVPCHSYQPGVVLVIGHTSGDISLWDLSHPGDKAVANQDPSKGRTLEVRAILKHGQHTVVALALSRDGRILVSADSLGVTARWASAEQLYKRFRHLALPGSGIASLPGTLLAGAISSRASTSSLNATLRQHNSAGSIRADSPVPEPNF